MTPLRQRPPMAPQAEVPSDEDTLWSRLHPRERAVAVRAAVDSGETWGEFARRWRLVARSSDYEVARVRFRAVRTDFGSLASSRSELTRRLSTAVPTPVGVTMAELRSGVCRWPLWPDSDRHAPGPDAGLYCGSPCDGKHSYCAGHRRLARRVPPPRREMRTRRRDET